MVITPIYQREWPSENWKRRPDDKEVEGALWHSMGEYIKTDAGRTYAVDFINKIGLSAHAYITPAGLIINSVPTDKVAYHAGKSVFGGNYNLNWTFLGCEFLVGGTHTYGMFLRKINATDGLTYTEAQYEAGGFLYAKWAKTYPKITRDRIVGHRIVAGDDVRGSGKGKRDPGPAFDQARFWYWFEHYSR
jgi:N-acetyl-anhydromuramyl-L-alanine amidase AmpD